MADCRVIANDKTVIRGVMQSLSPSSFLSGRAEGGRRLFNNRKGNYFLNTYHTPSKVRKGHFAFEQPSRSAIRSSFIAYSMTLKEVVRRKLRMQGITVDDPASVVVWIRRLRSLLISYPSALQSVLIYVHAVCRMHLGDGLEFCERAVVWRGARVGCTDDHVTFPPTAPRMRASRVLVSLARAN